MLEMQPIFLLYILKKMSFINARFFCFEFQKKCPKSSQFSTVNFEITNLKISLFFLWKKFEKMVKNSQFFDLRKT